MNAELENTNRMLILFTFGVGILGMMLAYISGYGGEDSEKKLFLRRN